MFIYLKFWRSAFVSDEKEVALAVDDDLLLEPAALGTLLLHVGAGEVAVDQGRLAGGQGADDAEPNVRNSAR